ncbi:hypothetical protein P692DRAFT_20229227 [Suillus brevipes Sb2]|nr:hypothetical protein P692DRAFT_20229227 [Suillus brevipes Sb2]
MVSRLFIWTVLLITGCTCFRPDARSVVAVNRHPVFIDAIIQTNGAGFVGTRGSTMSMIERWGTPGADDH